MEADSLELAYLLGTRTYVTSRVESIVAFSRLADSRVHSLNRKPDTLEGFVNATNLFLSFTGFFPRLFPFP